MAIDRKNTYILANHEGDEFEGSDPPGIKCIHQILFFSFYATFIAVYQVVYKNYETYFALCLLDTEYLIKYGAFQIDEICN